MLERLRYRINLLANCLRNLGLNGTLRYLVNRNRLRHISRDHAAQLFSTPYANFPLHVRPASSDLNVFDQIFVEREYACLDDVNDAQLIIDCGANVGYSSAYFLSRFPNARLIAVEPDPGNFEMLQLNLAPYGQRAKAICAGIWSRPGNLVIADVAYRDGREWSRQVRECRPGESSNIPAIDIGSLLEHSGESRISLLKIDIEGAEAEIFSAGYESWLERVDVLVVELHDDSGFGKASEVFDRAMTGRNFDVTKYGELTVAKRRR